MFMASKYEDIYPLLMRTVFKKIGHGKLPESQIKDRETKMLNSIGWNVGQPTCWEFFDHISAACRPFFKNDKVLEKEVSNLCLFNMMASIFDYEIARDFSDL